MKCDGSCPEHSGPVQRVHVRAVAHDWGIFHYCDAAIQEDRARGLQVVIVEDEGDDGKEQP